MALITDGLIAEFFGGLANGGTAPPTTPTSPTTWDCLTTSTYDGVLTNFPAPLTSSEGWVGDGTTGSPYALQVRSGASGADNGVAIGNSTALLSGLSAFSIDTWFNAPASVASTNPRIVDKSASSLGFSVYLSNSSGYIAVQFKASGASFVDTNFGMGTDCRGATHYICTTYSDADDTLHLYLDGSANHWTAAVTGGGTVQVGSDTACIGNRSYDYARAWDGWISTVRFYNKQLSASEIADNYNAGVTASSVDGAAATLDRSFLLARGIGIG
jgi:hypothetical protein